jgi:hypothetical protein
MLLRLEKHIAECLERAARAEEHARKAASQDAADEFLAIAYSWRHLGQSYEFVATLERFLADASTRRAEAAKEQ